MALEPFRTVAAVVEALAAATSPDGEEPVSVLEHHLQCATLLAASAPGDAELQVAGLVHDIAESLPTTGSHADHAAEGARLVRPLLGARVAQLVDGHVAAKRFLVAVAPEYASRLSSTSVATLARQGDAMSATDARRFAASPCCAALVALRVADDAAKDPAAVPVPLGRWAAVLTTVARHASG